MHEHGLALSNIDKYFGSLCAVNDVSLHIPSGQLVCFLGPSGCGKTTLLRIIAGLETPSSGSLSFDNLDITALPTHQRGFGMVFQSLALFPHLNVADNITYSMKIAGKDSHYRRQRVQELLQLIQLPDIARRRISQLSGGQRQRVAIARALAQEPRLFLLDEPLSSLDAKLREELQVELRLLQRQLKITTILVTHDQKEAMTMADTVVVMNKGRIEQTGPPLEIYRNPKSLFVADFIGQSNLLPAEIKDKTIFLEQQPLTKLKIPEEIISSQVIVSIRPENLRLYPTNQTASHRISAQVQFIRDLGASVEVHLNGGKLHFTSALTPHDWLDFREGDQVLVDIPADACTIFEQHN